MMDEEFHTLMAQLGIKDYTYASPMSGQGPCVITLQTEPSPPPVLLAIASYFQEHETQAIVLQKEGI